MKKEQLNTIAKAAMQIVAYINQFIAILGATSFANNPVYQWISFIFTVGITAATFWYNNDFTGLAITAGEVLDMLQDGKLTKEEVEEFVAKHKTAEEQQ